jgi:hypothetical protein
MKRPTVLFVACLLCLLRVQGQDQFMRDAAENSHGSGSRQFRLGYGSQTWQAFQESHAKGIGRAPGSTPLPGSISMKSPGALSFTYLNDGIYKFACGIEFLYQPVETQYIYGDHSTISYHSQYFMVMPGFEYRYINHEQFQIYSGISAGLSYGISHSAEAGNSSKAGFAFQGTALGLRCGNYFAVFGELGYGYSGIIHAGLSCRF